MSERDEPREPRSSDILGGLPRARPQRRSGRRPAPASAGPMVTPADSPATPSGPAPEPPKPVRLKTARKAKPPRPHARRARPKADPLPQPAQPSGTPSAARGHEHLPGGGGGVLASAVQAAAEITEFGLTTSAKVLRGALSRLPKR